MDIAIFNESKQLYIITDINRQLYAVGVPRNRSLILITENSKERVLTYHNEKSAKTAYLCFGFNTSDEARKYIQKSYPDAIVDKWGRIDFGQLSKYLIAIPVEITIKELT